MNEKELNLWLPEDVESFGICGPAESFYFDEMNSNLEIIESEDRRGVKRYTVKNGSRSYFTSETVSMNHSELIAWFDSIGLLYTAKDGERAKYIYQNYFSETDPEKYKYNSFVPVEVADYLETDPGTGNVEDHDLLKAFELAGYEIPYLPKGIEDNPLLNEEA